MIAAFLPLSRAGQRVIPDRLGILTQLAAASICYELQLRHRLYLTLPAGMIRGGQHGVFPQRILQGLDLPEEADGVQSLKDGLQPFQFIGVQRGPQPLERRLGDIIGAADLTAVPMFRLQLH